MFKSKSRISTAIYYGIIYIPLSVAAFLDGSKYIAITLLGIYITTCLGMLYAYQKTCRENDEDEEEKKIFRAYGIKNDIAGNGSGEEIGKRPCENSNVHSRDFDT
jgi:hypothetical protein